MTYEADDLVWLGFNGAGPVTDTDDSSVISCPLNPALMVALVRAAGTGRGAYASFHRVPLSNISAHTSMGHRPRLY